MKPLSLFAALLLLLPSLAFAAGPYARFPCPTGTPLPTECRCTVAGTAKPAEPPAILATEAACYADLAGQTGTAVNVCCVPANAWGAAAQRCGNADMTQTQPPAQLAPMVLVPTKP